MFWNERYSNSILNHFKCILIHFTAHFSVCLYASLCAGRPVQLWHFVKQIKINHKPPLRWHQECSLIATKILPNLNYVYAESRLLCNSKCKTHSHYMEWAVFAWMGANRWQWSHFDSRSNRVLASKLYIHIPKPIRINMRRSCSCHFTLFNC